MQVGAPASRESDAHKVPSGRKSGSIGSAGNIPDREADLSCTLHGRESRTAVSWIGKGELARSWERLAASEPAQREAIDHGQREGGGPPPTRPAQLVAKGGVHVTTCGYALHIDFGIVHVHFEAKIWICVSVCINDEEKRNRKKSQSAP